MIGFFRHRLIPFLYDPNGTDRSHEGHHGQKKKSALIAAGFVIEQAPEKAPETSPQVMKSRYKT